MTVSISYGLNFTANITPLTGDVANVVAASLATGGYIVLADTGSNTAGQILNAAGGQIGTTGFLGGASLPWRA